MAVAAKWSFLASVCSKAVPPFVLIVLARLLTPEDFGLVAVAASVVAFAQIFSDAGLGKALIQSSERLEDVADVTFWTGVVLAGVIYAALFAAAPLVAGWFADPRVDTVLRVQGLQIILSSLSIVPAALAERELDFKKVFWVQLAATATPGLASIPCAVAGLGYWALIAGSLLGSLVSRLMWWRLNPWRPRLRYPLSVARRISRFGGWVTAEGVLAWCFVWLDSLILGVMLDTQALGLYRTGVNLVVLGFSVVLSPILPVLYSALSERHRTGGDLPRAVLAAANLFAAASFPLGVGLFLTRELIADLVFGPAWAGISLVIGVVGLHYGLTYTIQPFTEAYRAAGRPSIAVRMSLIYTALFVPAYVMAAPYGLDFFLFARVGVACLGMLLHLYFMKAVFGIRPRQFLATISGPGLASVVMFLTASAAQHSVLLDNKVAYWILVVVVAVSSYGVGLRILDAHLWRIAVGRLASRLWRKGITFRETVF